MLAILWRMTREPDGKITRAIAALRNAADDFTKRLDHPQSRLDLSLLPESDRVSIELTCDAIQGDIESIERTARSMDGMKANVERLGRQFTPMIDEWELMEKEVYDLCTGASRKPRKSRRSRRWRK